MGSLTAAAALQLPIRLHGIQLGRPVDMLLDVEAWHALGFVVRCGDESQRFLPYAACQPSESEIAVQSALMLLDDLAFYEQRAVSFRSLLDGAVARHGRGVGELRDLVLGAGGAVSELELERDGAVVRIDAAGSTVAPTRATAA